MTRTRGSFDVDAYAMHLATGHPGATLACPRCGAEVRAHNLEHHVRSVHGATAAAAAPAPSARLVLRGADRASRFTLGMVFLAWCVAVAAWMVLRRPLTNEHVVVLGTTFVLTFCPLLVALLDVLPAELELDARRVRFSRWFGLLSREVALPATITNATIAERRPERGSGAMEAPPVEIVKIGSCVRLARDGRSITIGAAKLGRLGRRWARSGWSDGPTRKLWDITLDRESGIAAEYFLASIGQLTPKAD